LSNAEIWLRRADIPASAVRGVDDPRLRRAQVAAAGTDVGLRIVRHLLAAKFGGQSQVARTILDVPVAADTIDAHAALLENVTSVDEARALEAVCAQVYFAGWPTRDVIRFVAKDRKRVAPRWTQFAGRRSALRTGNSNQRAERPLNSLLNYAYRIGEGECLVALAAVGLDSGCGFLHADYPSRPALALDLLEAVRPEIEAFVPRLVAQRPFRKQDFVELPDGHVRLMPGPLTHDLVEVVSPMCARAVAPHAEAITHALLELVPGRTVKRTPLTEARRKAAVRRVRAQRTPAAKVALPERTCEGCGAPVDRPDYAYCVTCRSQAKERALVAAHAGQAAARARRKRAGEPDSSHTVEVRAARAASIGRRNAEALAWDIAHADVLVAPGAFSIIAAGLAEVPLRAIMSATELSKTYAGQVRRGSYIPHPRHWQALAQLAEVPCPQAVDTATAGVDVAWWHEQVVPALGVVPTRTIMAAIKVSSATASKLRRGLHIPNPKHWRALAELAGVAWPSRQADNLSAGEGATR
jgi:hypothetical protein